MLQATIILALTKDHHVIKHNVTPMEAMLLTAEHQKNVGGPVFEVQGKPTEIVIKEEVVEETPESETTDKETGMVKTIPAKSEAVTKTRTRTEDEEIARLKTKYAPNKVMAIANAMKNLPTTFDAAAKAGTAVVIPVNAMSSVKAF